MNDNNISLDLIDRNLADCLSNGKFLDFKKNLKILSKKTDCKQKKEIFIHVFNITFSKNLIKELKFIIKNFDLNNLLSKDFNSSIKELNNLYYSYTRIYNKKITNILNYVLIYINANKTKIIPFETINFLIEKYKITGSREEQFDTLFILCSGKYPWYIVNKFININNCSHLLNDCNYGGKKRNLVMATNYFGNVSILYNLLNKNNLFWENLEVNNYYIPLKNIISWKNKNKQKFLRKLLKKYPCKIVKNRLKEQIVTIILNHNPKLYSYFLQHNKNFIDSISFYNYCEILIETKSCKLLDLYLQKNNYNTYQENYHAASRIQMWWHHINGNFEEQSKIRSELQSNISIQFLKEDWISLFKKINPSDMNGEVNINRTKFYTFYKILLKYYPFNYFELFKAKYGVHERTLLESLVVIPNGLYLIKKYSKYIENWNYQNNLGWTAMLNAARYGDYQTVRYLLNNRRIKIETNTERCGWDGNDYYNIINCAIRNINIRVLKDCLQEIKNRKIKIKSITVKTFIRIIEQSDFLNYSERKRRFQMVYNFFFYFLGKLQKMPY